MMLLGISPKYFFNCRYCGTRARNVIRFWKWREYLIDGITYKVKQIVRKECKQCKTVKYL